MSVRTEHFPTVESAPHTPPDVAWLRQARERKGITLDQIATATKIRSTHLAALEAGAVDKLPPMFFIRGFVRSYAKEVGLDQDETADRYLQEIAPATAPVGDNVAAIVETAVGRTGVTGFDEHHAPLIKSLHPDRSNRLMLAAAVVGAIIYVGPFNWHEWTSNLSATPAVHITPAVEPVPVPAPAPAVEAAPAALAEQTGGPLRFEMKPSGDCWYSAAADGGQSQSGLLKAGDQRSIEVRDTIVLRVGDPGTCAFSINGHTGRPLAPAGAPVTVRITKDNFKEFVSS